MFKQNTPNQQLYPILLRYAVSNPNGRSYAFIQRWRFWYDNAASCIIMLLCMEVQLITRAAPLLDVTSGLALAILFLKGTAVIPGIFLSLFIGTLWFASEPLSHAILHASATTLLLLSARWASYRMIGAHLIHLNIRKQFILLLISMCYASIMTLLLSRDHLLFWFAIFNGVLIIPTLLATLDLYLVDWMQNMRTHRFQSFIKNQDGLRSMTLLACIAIMSLLLPAFFKPSVTLHLSLQMMTIFCYLLTMRAYPAPRLAPTASRLAA